MNLYEYIAAMQKLADEGHGLLPVCMGDDQADTYIQEVVQPPELEFGDYAGPTNTRFSWERGNYIRLDT